MKTRTLFKFVIWAIATACAAAAWQKPDEQQGVPYGSQAYLDTVPPPAVDIGRMLDVARH